MDRGDDFVAGDPFVPRDMGGGYEEQASAMQVCAPHTHTHTNSRKQTHTLSLSQIHTHAHIHTRTPKRT